MSNAWRSDAIIRQRRLCSLASVAELHSSAMSLKILVASETAKLTIHEELDIQFRVQSHVRSECLYLCVCLIHLFRSFCNCDYVFVISVKNNLQNFLKMSRWSEQTLKCPIIIQDWNYSFYKVHCLLKYVWSIMFLCVYFLSRCLKTDSWGKKWRV